MMPTREGVDAGTVLARALIASAGAAGCSASVDRHRSVPWSSATFVGEQHVLKLTLTGDPTAWLAGLPEAVFSLRGHLVADVRVVKEGDGQSTIEVLTLVNA